MMDYWTVSKRICINCGRQIVGYRDSKGLVKVSCPRCGLSMVSKLMSRRHERIDVYAPDGAVIDDINWIAYNDGYGRNWNSITPLNP